MEPLANILQYFKEHPEVTWSGAGLTALAVLYFLITKLFASFFRKKTALPVSNTFTHSGTGDQNVAQGDHPIAKQVNLTVDQVSSPQQKAKGDHNVFSQSGNVNYKEEHHQHHHYPLTPQGIPLQRSQQAQHLVGREKLLNRVLATLQPGKVVTLCGPGGIGKTALAARVAWELATEQEAPALIPDGLVFYSFYGRKDVGLAFDHLLRSYLDEAQENGPEAVCRLLANKQALIILDGAEEADDLPAVLRCCGGCGVLITSRKRSDAPGKLLKVKRLDKLPAEEAFRLYSGTTADKATVQAVCQQLGGWPLALRIAGHYLCKTDESAADYLRWLETEPLKELGDGKHQQENAALLLRRSVEQVSLKGQFVLNIIGTLALAPFTERPVTFFIKTFNYSTPWEFCKWVKRRIAHRRTWLLHYTDKDSRFCRKVLNELVDFGLLEKRNEGWQVSHALIYVYVRSKIPLNRWLLKGLAQFYIVFAQEQSKLGLEGYARLDGERVHYLRLIAVCLDGELWQEVKGLAGAMWEYLDRQGHWTEQLAALEMNLTAVRKAGDRWDEALCLNNLGYTCQHRGEFEQALAWYEQCLPAWRELGDREKEGITLSNIGLIYNDLGRCEQALNQYQQILSIQQEVGDREGEGRTLNNIGLVYFNQAEYDQAAQYFEQCLLIHREVGNKALEGASLRQDASHPAARQRWLGASCGAG
ncbi:MAG: tetratricopeptide repeat protein [Candidatus Electrothrix sp. AW1]|nr:tetratricopeptide repeat protein [Candidatus Electrothrix gigas]